MLTTAQAKIQQTKMLVTCQRFGDLFLFGLVWQYSSVQTKYKKGRFKVMDNGQLILKQNCRAVTSPKKRMDEFSSFKYFRVIKIEKQIVLFFFGGEKLWLRNFVSISTDL